MLEHQAILFQYPNEAHRKSKPHSISDNGAAWSSPHTNGYHADKLNSKTLLME